MRRITHRKPSFSKALDKTSRELLQTADRVFALSDNLDTAVRDTIADGLARLVNSAYDCQAMNLNLDGDAFLAFISSSTAEWFRSRGFAEWYCLGAGSLFHTSRPRIRSELVHIVRRHKAKRKAA